MLFGKVRTANTLWEYFIGNAVPQSDPLQEDGNSVQARSTSAENVGTDFVAPTKTSRIM